MPAGVIWIVDENQNVGTVDLATGAATVIGSAGVNLISIAFTPGGHLVGTDGSALYSINTATGAATRIGAFGAHISGIRYADGTLYGVGTSGSDDGIYAIGQTTASAMLIANRSKTSTHDVIQHPRNNLVFYKGALYETFEVAPRVDTTTNIIHPADYQTSPGFSGPTSGTLVAGPDGNLYDIDGTNIWSVDVSSGALTVAGNYTGSALGPAVAAASEKEADTNQFLIVNRSAGPAGLVNGKLYDGPVAGITSEWGYTGPGPDLNVTAYIPDVFIHTGSGTDAIDVSVANGNNVLDGGTGSNFLTGGTGNDTFYLDDRSPTATTWSTIANFRSGDSATVWGVTSDDFTLTWLDGQGAPGYTGLTAVFQKDDVPESAITLAGFTSADLNNGNLTVSWGRTADQTGIPGATFMHISAS